MPPVRLLLDARMARHGGIGTYVRHLVTALAVSGAVERCCLAGAPHGSFSPQDGSLCLHPYPAPIYSVWEQIVLPANPHGAQLWHSPHYNIPLRWRGPLVVTIHDLIPIQHPSWMSTPLAAPYAAFMLRQVARRASAVIAVSEATKRAFCAWAGMDPQRVTTIPHGVPPHVVRPIPAAQRDRVLAAYGVHPPFVLWVSAVRPHKNPLTVLRAFARLRARYQIPHQLVMVGALPRWYQTPWHEAQRLGLSEAIRWMGSVPAEIVSVLYQTARVLVMPSFEEGFGLPVLEAMAAGLPVLVSTTPALVELVGTAGVTIDPNDVDGWAKRLYTVLLNDDLHRTLQDQGRHRASQFTWADAVARHLEVYRAVSGTA